MASWGDVIKWVDKYENKWEIGIIPHLLIEAGKVDVKSALIRMPNTAIQTWAGMRWSHFPTLLSYSIIPTLTPNMEITQKSTAMVMLMRHSICDCLYAIRILCYVSSVKCELNMEYGRCGEWK